MLNYEDMTKDLDWRHYLLVVIVVLLFLWLIYMLFKQWIGNNSFQTHLLPVTKDLSEYPTGYSNKKDLYSPPISTQFGSTIDPALIQQTTLPVPSGGADSSVKSKKPLKVSAVPKRGKSKYKDNEDRIIRRKKCSKGEAECRRIMEDIFKAEFPTVEPWWLVNAKTGHRMEIDLFNKELGIGLEYHGKQHYDQKSFNQTDEIFQSQNERDELKYELCKQHNVYLITVPYTVPFDQLREYIVYYLPWNRKNRLDNDMTE